MDNGKRETVKILVLVLQIGIAMISALVVGGLLGYYLGRWLDAGWLILPGLFLGAVAGYQNVYRMVRKYTRVPEEKEEVQGEAEERRRAAEAEFLAWKREKEGNPPGDE